jgi:hypothetical protein
MHFFLLPPPQRLKYLRSRCQKFSKIASSTLQLNSASFTSFHFPLIVNQPCSKINFIKIAEILGYQNVCEYTLLGRDDALFGVQEPPFRKICCQSIRRHIPKYSNELFHKIGKFQIYQKEPYSQL